MIACQCGCKCAAVQSKRGSRAKTTYALSSFKTILRQKWGIWGKSFKQSTSLTTLVFVDEKVVGERLPCSVHMVKKAAIDSEPHNGVPWVWKQMCLWGWGWGGGAERSFDVPLLFSHERYTPVSSESAVRHIEMQQGRTFWWSYPWHWKSNPAWGHLRWCDEVLYGDANIGRYISISVVADLSWCYCLVLDRLVL